MFDKDTFEQARVEYGQLSPEDKAAFITSLEPNYQTDWITAFKAFLEDGDYARFESQTGIAALPVGQVHEPGMTREEGYQRDASDIAESSGEDYTPIKDLVKDMGDQYLIATPEVQEQYIKKITAAKGASFAENVAMCFSNRDFCEYIAQETQNYYDALAKNFAEAKSKSQFITKLGEFSEQKDLGGAVMEYITTGIPKEFSVLESVGMLTELARRSFSETGTLASAIEDLGEGEVTSDASETVAENLIDKIDDDIVDAVIAAGAKTEKASKVANMSEDDKEESVVREANQGNELMDALVEKFKALQTDEARTAMKEQLTSLLGEDVASYIIKRASGQDFEEVNPDDAAKDSVEGETPISETNPKNPQDVKLGGDIDKFEELSKNLMGEDVYAVPEAAPIRQAVVSAAPAAVAALPEGAPVAVANTGTTMEEGYQRDCALDDYANAGLLE